MQKEASRVPHEYLEYSTTNSTMNILQEDIRWATDQAAILADDVRQKPPKERSSHHKASL